MENFVDGEDDIDNIIQNADIQVNWFGCGQTMKVSHFFILNFTNIISRDITGQMAKCNVA